MPVLKVRTENGWEDISYSPPDTNTNQNNIYTQDDEPTDAPDGSLWIDMDAEGSSSGGGSGKAPVKGVDYWTDEDKAEIKAYVDEAILGGAW